MIAAGGFCLWLAAGSTVVSADSLLPTPSLPVATPTVPLPTPTLPIATPSIPLPPTPTLPIPSPTLPIPTPSPSLPISTPTPTPYVPTPTPSPDPTADPTPAPTSSPDPAGTPAADPTPTAAAAGSATPDPTPVPSQRGATPRPTPSNGPFFPLTLIHVDALTTAELVALASLPLLFGIGLLTAGRLWGSAAAMRGARLRLALAAELDLSPRELAQLSPAGLAKLRDHVAFDDLTGVLRRVAGVHAVEREIARARRSRTELSAVFIDLDGLKRINDTRGHRAGDQLIRGVAQFLRGALRQQDLVFRYGGDEFVCVLPGVGRELATEKFQKLAADAHLRGMMFSYGVGSLESHDDLVTFLARADERLYAAKRRNHGDLGAAVVGLPTRG